MCLIFALSCLIQDSTAYDVPRRARVGAYPGKNKERKGQGTCYIWDSFVTSCSYENMVYRAISRRGDYSSYSDDPLTPTGGGAAETHSSPTLVLTICQVSEPRGACVPVNYNYQFE
jgi:hypothetical protein